MSVIPNPFALDVDDVALALWKHTNAIRALAGDDIGTETVRKAINAVALGANATSLARPRLPPRESSLDDKLAERVARRRATSRTQADLGDHGCQEHTLIAWHLK